jgi:hypothetical protein
LRATDPEKINAMLSAVLDLLGITIDMQMAIYRLNVRADIRAVGAPAASDLDADLRDKIDKSVNELSERVRTVLSDIKKIDWS